MSKDRFGLEICWAGTQGYTDRCHTIIVNSSDAREELFEKTAGLDGNNNENNLLP